MIKIKGRVAKGAGNSFGNFQKRDVDKKMAMFLGVPELCQGTLNVNIDKPYSELDNGEYEGFIEKEYYNDTEDIKLKRCKANGFKCVLIRPSDHFWVEKFIQRIEIMSSEHLRTYFNLDEGDIVTVEFQGEDDWWNE